MARPKQWTSSQELNAAEAREDLLTWVAALVFAGSAELSSDPTSGPVLAFEAAEQFVAHCDERRTRANLPLGFRVPR